MTGNMTNVIWLTGVCASGKTTIAYALKDLVVSRFSSVLVLDADKWRTLWPELGLTREERDENVARIARAACLVAEETKDSLVIVACISPYKKVRDEILSLLRQSETVGKVHLVYLHAPLSTRIDRDPKGLYRKALKGEITGLTGYDGDYEAPSDALAIDTSKMTPQAAADLICWHFLQETT